jgi:Lon protease-like protein
MHEASDDSLNLDAVGLFPLPNVVLFPRAILPLHIFEFRYRQMTEDALTGARLVAMALLNNGWEKDYHGRPAIGPVVCVGKILSHEQLSDGKYNFLLQGHVRATISHEYGDRPYRYADLELLRETPIIEIDLSTERDRMIELFRHRALVATHAGQQFLQFLSSPMPTADVADLAAFHLVDKVPLKQELLGDPDVRRRVRRVITAIQELLPMAGLMRGDTPTDVN